MICDKCGATNQTDARFCSSCGSKILGDTRKYCTSCGTPNDFDALYCTGCGMAMDQRDADSDRVRTPKPSAQKHHREIRGRSLRKNLKGGHVTAAIAGVGLILIVIMISNRSNRKDPSDIIQVNKGEVAVSETKLRDPARESKAMQIASDFDCSCGTCGNLPLDTCTCPTAVKEREFIRGMVREGRSSAQIVTAVSKTYGHVKSRGGLTLPPLSGLNNSQ
ncbi:MAG: hypothetical protein B7Z63_02300 [Ignavibacteriae bacterium 37-53-5]|nr:MAG: hypothetical protein B7Z63_02300 [Ignavibacteriae bacterium 37-53-5]